MIIKSFLAVLAMAVLAMLTACTQFELYGGVRRMDTITTTTTANDGNFLCSVMGYCREGQKKEVDKY